MALIALLVIAGVAFVIVRVGATALRMTGLSHEVADFQAVSCFFGVGFTTAEAEMIVTHPVRRRIATHLIIAGNIGITSALATVVVTLLEKETQVPFRTEGVLGFVQSLLLMLVLVGLVVGVLRFGPLKWLIDKLIRISLERSGMVRAMDYETVLRAGSGYVVSEFEVDPGHPLIGRSLREAALGAHGVLVLGILRESGRYVGAPSPDSRVAAGDVLTVYGQETAIHRELSKHGPRATSDDPAGKDEA